VFARADIAGSGSTADSRPPLEIVPDPHRSRHTHPQAPNLSPCGRDGGHAPGRATLGGQRRRTPGDPTDWAAQQALQVELTERRLRWYPAQGGSDDRRHLEASAAVIGLTRTDAVALGRTYRQDAIFEWTSQDWSVIGCDVASPPSMGWRCSATGVQPTGAHHPSSRSCC
jgi:hypothetical protein